MNKYEIIPHRYWYNRKTGARASGGPFATIRPAPWARTARRLQRWAKRMR